jgi:hypothetical protein
MELAFGCAYIPHIVVECRWARVFLSVHNQLSKDPTRGICVPLVCEYRKWMELAQDDIQVRV